MIRISLTVLVLSIIHLSYAQNKQDYVWVFGHDFPDDNKVDGYIMDFNIKPIEPQNYEVNTRMDSNNASICDENGNLLFYTNGCHVMSADGSVMENGDSLNYDEWIEYFWRDDCVFGYPGAQDIMILTDPGNINHFYIIHKKIKFNGFGKKDSILLNYSVVDLSKNESEGKIIKKNNTLLSNEIALFHYLSSMLHSNGKDWWIVQPIADDSKFAVYLLDKNEFSLSFQSTNHYFSREHSSAGGTAKFSPDGTKYALYNYDEQLHVYDFDRSSGIISNHQQIKIFQNPDINDIRFCSVEWSPNSRFIYTASRDELHQVDTWENNIQEDGIRLIDTYDGTVDPYPTTFFLMAQAPDCRIYMCPTSSTNSYHVINYPDSLGKACDFVQNGIKLPHHSYYGSMPNFPRFRVDEVEKCDPTIVSVFGDDVWYRRDLEIYPNPSSGVFHLNLPGNQAGELVVRSLQGQVILKKEIDFGVTETSINISYVPSGYYHVEFYLSAEALAKEDNVFYSAQVVKE